MARSRSTLGAATAAVVAGALALTACQDGSPGAGRSGASSTPASATSSSPSPTRSYPLSSAPRTIPSVRHFQAAHGPGWKPSPSSGVVVASGGAGQGLGDEAQLIAKELKIHYRGTAAARPGDVELELGGGGPAESYTLTTKGGRVVIKGPDQSGVFYGTRTLKQSVRDSGAMPEGVVRDSPAKPERGLNLDIARKFYPASWIEARLRQMADLKLNELGLHFSDDQGFRIASTSHPEVVSKQHLTTAQTKQIIALATRLHITIVPEIDSPGHLGAVIAAHPDIQLRNASGTTYQGAVDISDPNAAKIVDQLLTEYAKLFPGPYFHIGGDEYLALTAQNPETKFPQLAAAARKKYGPKARVQDLATWWINGRAAVVAKLGKKPKVWNDGVFPDGIAKPSKDLQIEYWTGREAGKIPPSTYLKAGRKMVNLNDEYLYYVLGQPNGFTYPTGQRIYEEWSPLVLRGTTPVSQKYDSQVRGARFAVWGDIPTAQTTAQVAAGIRMPLNALAQRLWVPGKPALSWSRFTALADRVDSSAGTAVTPAPSPSAPSPSAPSPAGSGGAASGASAGS
ncbi:beta-N-acetylhexosaminidase [Streptomyces montanisoli]|uniref:Family 20 glycosylhydrolase n=1 Tax=Streptomyces montanisoli TaxID=2798581 RepID=A0A940MIZ1_9ACTN|nr:glycoside hydrolase family 20 protein [Streptomyces montanisoli]MBP0460940.1 family 20 glycosylhydrolase [Streptomyces montanisoli]